MRPSSVEWPVRRLRAGALAEVEADALAAEEPLEIRLNGRALVVTMRTPGNDEELALGFLVDEGILRPNADATVATVRNPLDAAHDNTRSISEGSARAVRDTGSVVNVKAAPEALLREPAARSFHASSACGVCGQASLEDMGRTFAPVASDLRLASALLLQLPDRMRERQSLFDRTGGLHAATLFDAKGGLVELREDIGRHNAVDKIVGWAHHARRLPLSEHVLVVSGRAGYEVVQKAVAAGIPIVAAVGAPSSLAARLAEQARVTLIGFLRGASFNVYSHAERIVS